MPQVTTFTKPSTMERNGYTDFQAMGRDIILDLIDRGFELVYPDPSFGLAEHQYYATLRPRLPTQSNAFTPDPLASSLQTWHIKIDCSGFVSNGDPGYIKIFVSHPLQLPEDGTVVEDRFFPGATTGSRSYIRYSGEVTSGWYKQSTALGPSGTPITADGLVTIPFASKFWGNTDPSTVIIEEDSGARTYSYRLTVSYHGIALVVWEEGRDAFGDSFSWIVVQRPVNPSTGVPLKTGKSPVFCMYSIGGGAPNDPLEADLLEEKPNPYARIADDYDNNAAIYRFTVREVDVYKPSTPVLATVDSPDHRMVINAKQQVAITEGNKYVVSFPNGFNTARYMYREEIDLITYTSADVISQYSNVAVSVYGEEDNRQYKAMQANLKDNTGMRILILTYGPGFDMPV